MAAAPSSSASVGARSSRSAASARRTLPRIAPWSVSTGSRRKSGISARMRSAIPATSASSSDSMSETSPPTTRGVTCSEPGVVVATRGLLVRFARLLLRADDVRRGKHRQHDADGQLDGVLCHNVVDRCTMQRVRQQHERDALHAADARQPAVRHAERPRPRAPRPLARGRGDGGRARLHRPLPGGVLPHQPGPVLSAASHSRARPAVRPRPDARRRPGVGLRGGPVRS